MHARKNLLGKPTTPDLIMNVYDFLLNADSLEL